VSKRKDRERFLALKNQDADYQGFRGSGQDSSTGQTSPLQAITCTVCGRRRNVSPEVALDQADSYVCMSCQEQAEAGSQEEATGEDEEQPEQLQN
jgi:DNA-directed RNA polymerase subunit RPC12/RpoP